MVYKYDQHATSSRQNAPNFSFSHVICSSCVLNDWKFLIVESVPRPLRGKKFNITFFEKNTFSESERNYFRLNELNFTNIFFLILQVIRRGKNILPTVARLCLIATFFEDGLRMYFQWNEQREYMDMSWGCGKFLATVFVIVNLFGQLGGCGMVIARFKVDIAVGLLFFIVVLQVCLSK